MVKFFLIFLKIQHPTNVLIKQAILKIFSVITLYSQQQGHVFTTSLEETKAFFGMHLVMGYHALPCMRDYWSSLVTLI